MTQDMSQVIVPKSDQINADTLLSGPQTFTIHGVSIAGGQEQPVSIALEETNLLYRPCKSMCRLLVAAWGADAKLYTGHSMTLYCDPTVKWGPMEVGGIRISHLSHMEKPLAMALTATKGVKKITTVKPLQLAAPVDWTESRDALAQAAQDGTAALQSAWKGLGKEAQVALKPELGGFKEVAAQSDPETDAFGLSPLREGPAAVEDTRTSSERFRDTLLADIAKGEDVTGDMAKNRTLLDDEHAAEVDAALTAARKAVAS